MNLGVFVLHAVQLSMWVAVPLMLVRAGVARERHWLIYLPAVLLSFAVMGASLFRLERGGHLRTVFLGSIALAALVQAGFWFASGAPGAWLIGVLLFLFFCSFNVLEASQPSLTSRLAPAGARGAALGVYNTCQSLGLFAGGLVGGTLYQSGGPALLFGACGLALLLWLAIAWPMRVPGRAGAAAHS
jgi:predicted MFS family arabinose efflux permease